MSDAVRLLCTNGMSLHDALDALTPTRAPQVGDILACGWGWEQTRYDFYQVVKVMAKSVRIAQIESRYTAYNGHGSATVVPIPDALKTHRGTGESLEPLLRRFEYTTNTEFLPCAGPCQRIYPERADSEVFGQPLASIEATSKTRYMCKIKSYSTAYLWDGEPCEESGEY